MQRNNRMRIIGNSLDVGYRDDLNFNFGLISTLVAGSSSENEKLKEELDAAVKNLQTQINLLTGENIDELIARLNDSAQQALEAAQNARIATDATEEATNLANVATSLANASAVLADEKANYADEKAILAQKAAENANIEASNLGQLKVDVVQATQDANVATTNANEATGKATVATNAINAVLPNVTGLENKTSWMVSISYKKNNFVTFNGNGYIALQDNVGVTPPLPPSTSNDDWSLYTLRGEKGEQGTGVSILGSLNSIDDLPITGSQGEGYLINKEINGEKVAELYVWSETTLSWENVGNIKGPKGDTGDQGPKGEEGPPGKDADLTGITQEVYGLKTTLDKHLTEIASATNLGHIKVGENLTITPDGTLNAEAGGGGSTLVVASSADGLTYSVNLPNVTEYTVGMQFTMQPEINSKGSVKISINGLTPTYLTYSGTGLVTANGITVDGIYNVSYTGKFFVLVGDGFGLLDSFTSNAKNYAATTNAVKMVNDKIDGVPVNLPIMPPFGTTFAEWNPRMSSVGSMVGVDGSVKVIASLSSNAIVRLPSGYFPRTDFPVVLRKQRGGAYENIDGAVNSTGSVVVTPEHLSKLATNDILFFNFTFLKK